jgi:hypothetical protein
MGTAYWSKDIHRNRIHYKAKTTNNSDYWKKFREIRNEVIDLVRKAKDEYKNKLMKIRIHIINIIRIEN